MFLISVYSLDYPIGPFSCQALLTHPMASPRSLQVFNFTSTTTTRTTPLLLLLLLRTHWLTTMNCPSRTDDTLEHTDWNQNPPVLAPDLTTRQDLNGISNARELHARAALAGASLAGWDEAIAAARESEPDKKIPVPWGASLTPSGMQGIFLSTARGR